MHRPLRLLAVLGVTFWLGIAGAEAAETTRGRLAEEGVRIILEHRLAAPAVTREEAVAERTTLLDRLARILAGLARAWPLLLLAAALPLAGPLARRYGPYGVAAILALLLGIPLAEHLLGWAGQSVLAGIAHLGMSLPAA